MTDVPVFFFSGNLRTILEALNFTSKKIQEYYRKQIQSVDQTYHEAIRREMRDRLEELNRVAKFLNEHSTGPWFVEKAEYDHLASVIRSALDIYARDLEEQKKRTGIDAFDRMIDATKETVNLEGIKDATTGRFDRYCSPSMQTSSDTQFMRTAIDEARQSKSEDDRPHPKVGVVVQRDGRLLEKAHRGELALGDHAEYTALERKLRDKDLAGATLYTTLEPCTTRGAEKTPCAERIILRRIATVVIGMMDPNRSIRGDGVFKLKEAHVEVRFFDAPLEQEILELNKDFIEAQSTVERPLAVFKPENQDAYLTREVSDDFTRCRDASRAFHQSEPHNVRLLLLAKYDDFLTQRELRYPRIFDNARRDGWSGITLYERLCEQLGNVPNDDRDLLLADYVAHIYGIDAAIVAHIAIRKAFSEPLSRSELAKVVTAYHRRLSNLYYHEVRFGRADVAQFFNDNAIVWLLNVDEADAVDYIDSCLTDALWRQLNIAHGWFDGQARSAEENFASKKEILERAWQRPYPFENRL